MTWLSIAQNDMYPADSSIQNNVHPWQVGLLMLSYFEALKQSLEIAYLITQHG